MRSPSKEWSGTEIDYSLKVGGSSLIDVVTVVADSLIARSDRLTVRSRTIPRSVVADDDLDIACVLRK